MFAVPADTPVTTPAASTVATLVLLLLHTPPVLAVANVVVAPAQILLVPVIGATTVGNTVIVKVPVPTLLLSSVALTVTVVTPTGNTVLGSWL
jgi:hypothetical protein